MIAPAGPSFAELFAAIPVALLVIDPARRIAHANADCENLLNLSERAMVGQRLDTVLKAPGEPGRRAEHGFAAFDSEIVLTRGGSIRADYLESQIADHPGWRVIALHHDASRRLGHSADRASAARAAVGAAAMLAHEIKNPLSGIRGAAQLLAGSGEGSDELTTLITTEVDRYISWPGQALSYKLGEITIRRLRAEAEQQLGTRFDIKKFHTMLLGLGSVPLPVLEEQVHQFIAASRAAPAPVQALR